MQLKAWRWYALKLWPNNETVMVAMHPVGPTWKDGKMEFPADSDNAKFWEASPSGEFRLFVKNPAAAEKFVEGAEYYFDITRADAPAPAAT